MKTTKGDTDGIDFVEYEESVSSPRSLRCASVDTNCDDSVEVIIHETANGSMCSVR